uniref:Uncharacterized protein n=1 Tax=Timema poppense TaxID=170557 RepID=A0A7R9H8N3_TIMPO|nr:unnamed protein product [Timema poppensis]
MAKPIRNRLCQEHSGTVVFIDGRCLSSATKPLQDAVEEKQQDVSDSRDQTTSDARKGVVPPQYRFVYPEFLPDPKIIWRNKVREKLERADMLSRRCHIDIPEFYVGHYATQRSDQATTQHNALTRPLRNSSALTRPLRNSAL